MPRRLSPALRRPRVAGGSYANANTARTASRPDINSAPSARDSTEFQAAEAQWQHGINRQDLTIRFHAENRADQEQWGSC
ncbi:hypothetical protein TPA0908_39460 [Micromonospora sp. AKA38]|nr:hypothetical protein TPA0908_39460 [Micromonospora sp. AKA38]